VPLFVVIGNWHHGYVLSSMRVICLVFRSTHASCKDVLTREKNVVFWSFSENGNFREFCGKREGIFLFQNGNSRWPCY
jgi:hypothetical protein